MPTFENLYVAFSGKHYIVKLQLWGYGGAAAQGGSGAVEEMQVMANTKQMWQHAGEADLVWPHVGRKIQPKRKQEPDTPPKIHSHDDCAKAGFKFNR